MSQLNFESQVKKEQSPTQRQSIKNDLILKKTNYLSLLQDKQQYRM